MSVSPSLIQVVITLGVCWAIITLITALVFRNPLASRGLLMSSLIFGLVMLTFAGAALMLFASIAPTASQTIYAGVRL